ncbi:MAG: hypothetical protein WD767_01515 [Alphaproteobacteria bacterium]
MKILKQLFRAYLVFLFIAGHIVVGMGALIAYDRIGKSPRQIFAIAAGKLKSVNHSLGSMAESLVKEEAPKSFALIKLPGLEEWRGPGASVHRPAWRPAYGASGKPVSEADIALGIKPTTVAGGFPERIVSVDTTESILNAVSNAQPGDAITLKPGIYTFKGRGIPAKTPGRPDAPIAVRAETLGTVTLRFDMSEGFIVEAPYWIFENLQIEGICTQHTWCEHGLHVVGKADSVVIRNNRLYDFNAQLKVNNGPVYGLNGKRHSDFPDFGLVEGNTVADRGVRETGNPVTKLNINGGNDWVVRANLIADFEKGRGDQISYAAFMKANGKNGVFENNAVICHMNLESWDGIRLGLSFGGGGTGKNYCRDFSCETEHTGGVIRNNVIMNCPKDVGIYLNRSKDTTIVHNGIYNTVGVDVRFPTSSAYLANNIIDGRIRERDGGQSTAENNLTPGGGIFGSTGISALFADPINANFDLIEKDAVIGRGIPLKEPGVDFCARKRKTASPDLGPLDYAGPATCDVRNIWKR